MKILWGEKTDYYTQRNNMRVSSRACGRTALVNALDAAGYFFPVLKGQAEDDLYDFIQQDEACRILYMKKPANSRINNPIEEWQDILALGANRWLGLNACRFNEFATSESIFKHVTLTGPCIVTGAFPTLRGKLFHSVALLGVEWEEEPRKIEKWIINDPWGDHRTFYRMITGKHVDFSHEEFVRILFAGGSDLKWCIFVNKP